MKTENYKGYVIKTNTSQLRNTSEWTVNVIIELHSGDQVKTRPFNMTTPTYKTPDEAEEQCLKLGRQIIDGCFEELSVEDM